MYPPLSLYHVYNFYDSFFYNAIFPEFLCTLVYFKNTLSPGLKYLLILLLFLDVITLWSGCNLFKMDLIFRVNINSAGDIPDTVLGFGIIL